MATSLLVAGLPPELELIGGSTIRFDAVDPTTGASVAGVKITYASLFAVDLGRGQEPIPLLTPLSPNDQVGAQPA